ncbi:hypothetical protein [Nocardia wallacei]|uniref:hypothetical protein n=1 Tax=Nocardia wallacei TaxID=480035 RepID=UPI0024580B3C|nr:hypothetical protein [Nocardia wallacei]
MTRFDPDMPSGLPLTAEQAEMLRTVHASASAYTVLLEIAATETWPEHLAAAQADAAAALVAYRSSAVRNAGLHEVPARTIAMAWLAGQHQHPWPAVDPVALDAALERLTWQELVADRDRLLDMAAIDTVTLQHPEMPQPEPEAITQLHSNATALSEQIAAVQDVLQPSDEAWRQLWAVDGAAIADRYHSIDAETLQWRFASHADPVVGADARATTAQLAQIRRLAAAAQPDTDAVTVDGTPGADITTEVDHHTQAAVDDALAGADHDWHPGTETDPGTAPSPDPGVDL